MTKIKLLLAGTALFMIQACGDGFETTENGLKYKIHNESTGTKIALGDYVTMQMMYKTSTDSLLFSTYKTGTPVSLMVSEPSFPGDLMAGLLLVAENDSVTFLINADSLFSKTIGVPRPDFIKEGSDITFDVKITKVIQKANIEQEIQKERQVMVGKEKADIEKYIADNKLQTVKTGTGLEYVISKQGSGIRASEGDTVTVQYTGKLLNGKKFDSSYDQGQPYIFPVGKAVVIKGWDETFMLFNKGTRATIIIPSHLGYGPQGAGDGVIPPYSPLVFDVELVDVKKAQ